MQKLDSYYLLYAVLGELEFELGDFKAAAGHFRRAVDLVGIDSEQLFLTRKLQACEEQA
jgi:predicted RNA polymerase sigma factor